MISQSLVRNHAHGSKPGLVRKRQLLPALRGEARQSLRVFALIEIEGEGRELQLRAVTHWRIFEDRAGLAQVPGPGEPDEGSLLIVERLVRRQGNGLLEISVRVLVLPQGSVGLRDGPDQIRGTRIQR